MSSILVFSECTPDQYSMIRHMSPRITGSTVHFFACGSAHPERKIAEARDFLTALRVPFRFTVSSCSPDDDTSFPHREVCSGENTSPDWECLVDLLAVTDIDTAILFCVPSDLPLMLDTNCEFYGTPVRFDSKFASVRYFPILSPPAKSIFKPDTCARIISNCASRFNMAIIQECKRRIECEDDEGELRRFRSLMQRAIEREIED